MIAEHSSKIMKTNLFLLLAVGGKKKKKNQCSLYTVLWNHSKAKLLASIYLIIHPKLAPIQEKRRTSSQQQQEARQLTA